MKTSQLSLGISSILMGVVFTSSAVESTRNTNTDSIEQITIFGSAAAVSKLPGSGAYIGKEALDNYAVTDIQRILSSTAGVYFVEEDGYGLRPNIGMRGSSSDRSDKITIMEDGVLAAPAPYASPAAYYFPTVGRMQAVEILKGGSTIEYGPRTSGGVINLVSTAVPQNALGGKFDFALGSDGFSKLHTFVGGRNETSGGLVEIYNYQADGFKTLNSGQDTGFNKTDLLTKFDIYLDDAKRHQLEFKLKYSDESSDETYVGITQQDFSQNPFQRYSATQLDNMSTEHKHASVHYDYIISENMDLSVIAYINDFGRNWYKVSKINGSSLGSGAEEIASNFDAAVFANAAPDDITVTLKANNREYLSRGIQGQFALYLDNHKINIGARMHNDEIDRFQWVDQYALTTDFSMSLLDAGVPGTDSNRIDSANAYSFFIKDKMTFGDFIVTAGVRYENVNLARDDWGKTDPRRTENPSERNNEVNAFLPSVGATYQANDNWVLLAGVQKAFAPPSPGNNNADNEEGWNYEFGGRFSYGSVNGELIGFVTNLDNLHGNCTASQGCNDDLIGQQYNAGKVDISGIEFVINHRAEFDHFAVPTRFNYTYSSAEFAETFDSELNVWGSVEDGFDIPYLPKVTWQLESGVAGDHWQVLAAVKYVDEMRFVAGNDNIDESNGIKARTIVDISANYQIDEKQSLYIVLDNLFDKKYAVTRQHGGLQVGKSRSFQVGYRYQL
nr:TonB-dependent receptor [uncultured Glaciecola sp.]